MCFGSSSESGGDNGSPGLAGNIMISNRDNDFSGGVPPFAWNSNHNSVESSSSRGSHHNHHHHPMENSGGDGGGGGFWGHNTNGSYQDQWGQQMHMMMGPPPPMGSSSGPFAPHEHDPQYQHQQFHGPPPPTPPPGFFIPPFFNIQHGQPNMMGHRHHVRNPDAVHQPSSDSDGEKSPPPPLLYMQDVPLSGFGNNPPIHYGQEGVGMRAPQPFFHYHSVHPHNNPPPNMGMFAPWVQIPNPWSASFPLEYRPNDVPPGGCFFFSRHGPIYYPGEAQQRLQKPIPTRDTREVRERRSLHEKRSNMNLNLSEESICRLCRSNGEPIQMYTSHVLKDRLGNITCPILRKYSCPKCNATGDNAHTIRYCPLVCNEGSTSVTTCGSITLTQEPDVTVDEPMVILEPPQSASTPLYPINSLDLQEPDVQHNQKNPQSDVSTIDSKTVLPESNKIPYSCGGTGNKARHPSAHEQRNRIVRTATGRLKKLKY